MVRYNRSGVDEWYSNGPLGLEQGFTIDRRVAGTGELTLVVGRVPAGAHVTVASDGGSLAMGPERGAGAVLHYSDVSVIDARGRRVPARIATSDDMILLRLDDARARYPLRIDPTVDAGGASLTATGGMADDGYGFAVAISQDGSTIAVSASDTFNGGVGNVYVFTRPASGGWQNATIQTATLDVGSADGFGFSVAVSGNGGTVVVGAPFYYSTDGTVYLFNRPSGGWQNSSTPTAVLTASDGSEGDDFGWSVAISTDGSTVVAGAPDHASAAGAAYVFSEPTNGWSSASTETVELTADDGAANDNFGESVAISGDGGTVVAGAPGHASSSGAAYVFTESATDWQGTDTEALELTSNGDQTQLGGSVAISADDSTIVAGGIGFADVLSKPASGAWWDAVQTAELPTDSDPRLGVAVSGDGGTIMIGSDSTTSSGAGRAEVFDEPSGGWQSEAPTLDLGGADVPSEGAGTHGVALSGDGTAVVGIADSIDGGPVLVFPPAPVASSPPLVSGDARQGQTLTESHGSWSSYPASYTYQWEDCNSAGAACTPIVGATGPSYTLTNADAGHTVAVQEVASNVTGAGIPATSSPTAVVIPLLPTSSGVLTISGTAVEGDTLTASLVAWTNTPASVSYQWERCDAAGQNCQPIAGATGKTYTLAAGDIGYRIVVEESAANAGGTSATVSSAATGAIPESGPVGLEIDNGDYATDDPNVTIEAAWPPGTQSILISNNGGFRTDTKTFAPAATIAWKLEQTGTDRLPKTVYVRFLGVGQDDINFTDDIILDEIAPTIQSATLGTSGTAARAQASAARATKLKAYKLRLKAKDTLVGVCEVATSQSRSDNGEVLTPLASCHARGILKLSRTLELKLRSQPRYVRVRNSAGDWSRWTAVKS